MMNIWLRSTSSNLQDSAGRPIATSFSSQSATTPGFHHSGALPGLHNVHGSFNVLNVPSSLASRNASMSGVPSSGVQQPGGSISSGRFGPNNLPVGIPQISNGRSLGYSGVTNRGGINVVGNPGFSSNMNGVGGSIPGISSSSVTAGNRNSVPGLSSSAILGNVGPRMTSSMGNIVSGGNIGRSISSGGLSVPGLSTRINLAGNSGSGSLNLQGTNRLMGSMFQQAPQMLDMLGNSYPTSGELLSHGQVQAGNNALSMSMLNYVNPNDNSPFDMNDFPQLSGRPSSAGGTKGQLGSLRKQGVGVSSIVQQNQEFSIQNEDFPALPGFKVNISPRRELLDSTWQEQQQHAASADSKQWTP